MNHVKLKLFVPLVVALLMVANQVQAAQDKPNILVIMGDDVGIPNLSVYSHGMMGYQTPSIDRIAREGVLFTDYYGEQSCTAGRSAFITAFAPVHSRLDPRRTDCIHPPTRRPSVSPLDPYEPPGAEYLRTSRSQRGVQSRALR